MMSTTRFNAEQEAKSLTFFAVGLFVRETYSFLMEGGLSGEYPLCKSLFYMIVCLAAIGVLFVPTLRGYMNRLSVVETTVKEVLKTLRGEEGNAGSTQQN